MQGASDRNSDEVVNDENKKEGIGQSPTAILEKFNKEQDRYEETLQYIREVEEILNLIKPFPRSKCSSRNEILTRNPGNSESAQSELSHLTTMVKLVEKLKELKETNLKFSNARRDLTDLKKLRDERVSLKCEELKMRTKTREDPFNFSPGDEQKFYRRSKSSSDDFSEREINQQKRKSICVATNSNDNKFKIFKWTKVKEAFHHRDRHAGAPLKCAKTDSVLEGRRSFDGTHCSSSTLYEWNLQSLPPPPPPPPPPAFNLPNLQDPSPGLQDSRGHESLTCDDAKDGITESDYSNPSFGLSSADSEFDCDGEEEDEEDGEDGDGEEGTGDDTDENDELVPRRFSSGELLLNEIPRNSSKEDVCLLRCSKSNSTAWSKVKNIIHTKKEGTAKKRDQDFQNRRRSCLSSLQFSNQSDIFSVPDEIHKNPNKSCYYQRLSKWMRVKNAVLPSSSPTQSLLCSASYGDIKSHFSDIESHSGPESIDEKRSPSEKEFFSPTQFQDFPGQKTKYRAKFKREFDEKLGDWDVCRPLVKSDDMPTKSKHDDACDDDLIPKFWKSKETHAQLPSLGDLSPDFRKKLDDWEKLKVPKITLSTVNGDTDKSDERQRWRSRGSTKSGGCSKGYQEKGTGVLPKLLPAKAANDLNGKQNLASKMGHDKNPGEGGGGDTLVLEKEAKPRLKTQNVKDFRWVEKELQKIGRERIKLEQERDKFLQREIRLEQMKRTISNAFPGEEIIVRVPTGFIRFEGISEKFTKKLYEWEMARGIAPEASTFALLEENLLTTVNDHLERTSALDKDKFHGSVPDLSSPYFVHELSNHSSSLSLNNVNDLRSSDSGLKIALTRVRSEGEYLETL